MNRPPQSTRRPTALLLAFATVVLLGIGVGSAAAASSIEGIWAFGGGRIAITSLSNGTFVGTVVAETKFAECVHRDGQQIWTDITEQPDGSFWGLHQWYFEKTCVENPERGRAAWRFFEEPNGSKYLLVCLSRPGPTEPQPTIAANGSHANESYGCFKSLLTAPLPTAGLAGFIQRLKPSAKACVSGRRFKIHLPEPQDDPFKTLRIMLRGHRITMVRKGEYVVGTVNLKGVPLGTFTLKIKATTVLGLDLTGSRTYHTCAKVPKQHKPARLKASHPA
jgi:hypothetical protein